MYLKIRIPLLFCSIGFFLGVLFSPILGNYTILEKNISLLQDNLNIHANEDDKNTQSIDPYNTKKILQTKNTIEEKYYKFSEKSAKEIEDSFISALVDSLGDKHSAYFPPSEAKDFLNNLNGDFEGIGAVIDTHIRGIVIRKIFPNSPANKAGLQAGDVIIRVGNDSMIGLTADEAVKKIRGPKGTQVIITYTRGENLDGKVTTVTRDTIIVPSTQASFFTGSLSKVGYLEVSIFGENTPEEFQKSFQNLINSGATAIVLDFRNNGGGYLNAAVDILSYLLPDKSVAVITKENDPNNTEALKTYSNNITNTKIPIIMLVNNFSASATEIVAGALQDYDRAIIVGENTYGKGSVQEPFALSDGSIIKLTVAKWYTPKDVNIDKNGITPDIFIPIFDRDYENKFDRQLEYAKKIIQDYQSYTGTIDSFIQKNKLTDFTK